MHGRARTDTFCLYSLQRCMEEQGQILMDLCPQFNLCVWKIKCQISLFTWMYSLFPCFVCLLTVSFYVSVSVCLSACSSIHLSVCLYLHLSYSFATSIHLPTPIIRSFAANLFSLRWSQLTAYYYRTGGLCWYIGFTSMLNGQYSIPVQLSILVYLVISEKHMGKCWGSLKRKNFFLSTWQTHVNSSTPSSQIPNGK